MGRCKNGTDARVQRWCNVSSDDIYCYELTILDSYCFNAVVEFCGGILWWNFVVEFCGGILWWNFVVEFCGGLLWCNFDCQSNNRCCVL